MKQSRRTGVSYCSQQEEVLKEPLAGTAAHQQNNLLIRWPKRGWDDERAIASDMPAPLRSAIEAVQASGRRVNLIDRKSEAIGRHRLFLFPEARTIDVEKDELTAIIAAVALGESQDWTSFDGRVLLVCTHGKIDRCCAKWGFPVYKQLSDAAHDMPDKAELWEATHLGGCRMAPCTLSFPAMLKHGRISAADAVPLLDADRLGRPLAKYWRGPTGLSQPQQVAIAYIYEISGNIGVIEQEETGPDSASLVVKVQDKAYRVTLQAEMIERATACDDLDDNNRTSARIWVVRQAEEVRTRRLNGSNQK